MEKILGIVSISIEVVNVRKNISVRIMMKQSHNNQDPLQQGKEVRKRKTTIITIIMPKFLVIIMETIVKKSTTQKIQIPI